MRNVYLVFLAITLAIVVALPRTGQCQKTGSVSRSNPAYVEGNYWFSLKSGSTDNDKAGAYRWVSAEEVEVVLSAKNRSDGRGDLVLIRHTSDYSHQAAVNAFSSDPSVEFAEPNWIYTHQATSDDTYYTNGQLWGMYGASTSPLISGVAMQRPLGLTTKRAASRCMSASLTKVFSITIKTLRDRYGPNPYDTADGVDNDGNGYKDDIHGWDFFGNDKTVYDGGKKGKSDDHGTHVSGTIGGIGGNGKGVVGVNWNITLISAKFLGPTAAHLLTPLRPLITSPILRPGMG